MSQEQVREAEAAREQARLAAEKFEKIRQAQEALHGELPAVPKGRLPEAVPHRKIEVAQLPRAPKGPSFRERYGGPSPFRLPKRAKAKAAKPSKRGGRRIRIFGPLLARQAPHAAARLRENTPANISRAEKEKALKHLDAAIAAWSRKYTFRMIHGGTPQEKQEAAVRLRELQGEREAVASMKPLGLPEHIRRAEYYE